MFIFSFLSFIIVLHLLGTDTAALPHVGVNVAGAWPGIDDSHGKRDLDNGVQLRILPLGASIVYGFTSYDGNGFRYGLRNQLVYDGNHVNMIGSVQAGTMADNDCEGWPGYVITQVAEKAELSIPSQPNLVLLHLGTNDCVQDIDINNAGSRLKTLIDRLFDAIPDVTIVASTLLPNGNANTQANVKIYNSQIPGIVQDLQVAGQEITYVDFSSSYFSLSDLGSDGTHPTAAGYQKMAEVWYQGIQVANGQGWLSAPATVSGVSDIVTAGSTTCDKTPGASIGPTQTQMGSGSDDGAYVHIAAQVAGFAGFRNPSTVNFNNPLPEGVFWADIDGDGIDDYVYVGSDSDYGLGVALSLGGGEVGSYLYSTFPNSCKRSGVRFADMTGDGRDDFCCLGPDGGLVCWQNKKGSDARSPSWTAMGTVKESEGYPQAQVRLADIDGDGRADYVVFDGSTTNIYGWRNGATSNGPPEYWYSVDGVFNGLPAHELSGWQFVDLNGDHKDDLVWMDANGQVTTWINRRGFSVGLEPQWVSHGSNMLTGLVSLQFINSTGAITLFENDHNWGYWKPWGVIYNANRARQEIHLADFDGDGKCDILLVDKASGATTVIQNKFSSGVFTFSDLGVVTGSATCTEGYGYDKHDLGVRWNDLDGDGRADFLCMQTDGVINGYLNKGVDNMVDQGLIKHGEGKERKNLRLADINGDGKDDFLYVNMLNGSVTAWNNGGRIQSSGSAFQWNWQGVVSPGGSSRGACVEFGALYGLERADYIVVDPSTNKAWTWFNVCPDGIGPVAPSLPSGAPSAPAVSTSSSNGTSDAGDDDDDFGDSNYQSCDYSLLFNNLDDLNAAAGGLRTDCISVYALETLITMLDTAYANYTTINDGYDEEFGYYVTYMENLVQPTLDTSVMFAANLSTDTMEISVAGPGMSYFDCQTSKKHMVFGDHEVDKTFTAPRAGRKFEYKFTGYPVENATMVVPNPKDIVTQGLGSIPDLQIAMEATLMDMILGNWADGSTADAAQAYSTPVFMLMEAVDSMAQAKALGKQEQKEEKEEEKRKKDFILLIVSVVLMIIPFVGQEVALAAGFADLARAITIAGELGNAALSVYDTVEDPKSAVVNILGMLVGVGAIAKASRDGKGVGGIANIRRSMKADDVSSLGSIFKNNDDKLQAIMKGRTSRGLQQRD
ncbi:hypothetical protein LTR85_011815 [Meristemomyces frigidus]|nr:hypothetical protein LTR85_011815 [Meristemomyces frigidus]